MLKPLISSQTRVKLLTVFLLNPGRDYYIREISRLIGENINAVRRELSNLETFGLLSMNKRGNQVYYSANQDFFLYEELQKIVLKTEGIAGVLEQQLDLAEGIECLFIFGSYASGKADAKSDIDLFIVGNVREEEIIPPVHASEKLLGREINYVLMRREDLQERIRTGDPFVKTVMQEPRVLIKGRCDD